MQMRIPGLPFLLSLLIGGLVAWPAQAQTPSPRKLALKEALRLAWKANPTLQISRVEELIAGEEIVRARSGFLPRVRADVSHTVYDDPVKMQVKGLGPISSFPMTNRNFWGSRLVVEQTVFDLATISRYQAAVLGKTATRLDTAQVRDNLFLSVCQGYFRVLRAEKLVTVAEQEVKQLTEHLRDARNLYEFGLVTYNDVLQAEVALSDAEQRLITAQNDVTNLKSALNKLMGLPIATPIRLEEEDKLVAPALSLEEASETALRQRNDLKAAKSRIEQGEKNISQAKSGYYPRLFAQAGHTYQQNDAWLHEHQYFAILGLEWSLFSGFDTRAQVRQAKQRLEQLHLHKQDLAEQIRLEVQTAYLGMKETAERIRVTQKAVAQGEENLRLNQERYREQVGTATEVIDAQTLLTKARVNYFNAHYDHQMAKAQMLWAVGGINGLADKTENVP
jgi:TolC family type I secretion outer membrane protein|uniref:TolC family protein n=1 Tax=Desulfobacca acetoxidans TaxID=60893 RepID=A0A7C3SLL3_9BACT